MVHAHRSFAIYWDVENIHLSMGGSGDHFSKRFEPSAISAHFLAQGRIRVQRAYGNWTAFPKYLKPFAEVGADTIQVISSGVRQKNGADIRMALDAFEDSIRHPDISDFVIVSGDSDFSALLTKLKLAGRRVCGVGVTGCTSARWKSLCDDFLMLQPTEETPAPVSTVKPVLTPAVEQGLELLVRLLESEGSPQSPARVGLSQLVPKLQAVDPSFSLARMGFRKVSEFIQSGLHRVVHYTGEGGGSVGLRPTGNAGLAGPTHADVSPEDPTAPAEWVEGLARRGFHIPPRTLLRAGIEALIRVEAAHPEGFASKAQFCEVLRDELLVVFGPVSNVAFESLRLALFKAWTFRPSPDGKWRLKTGMTVEQVEVWVAQAAFARCADLPLPPVTFDEVALALIGRVPGFEERKHFGFPGPTAGCEECDSGGAEPAAAAADGEVVPGI